MDVIRNTIVLNLAATILTTSAWAYDPPKPAVVMDIDVAVTVQTAPYSLGSDIGGILTLPGAAIAAGGSFNVNLVQISTSGPGPTAGFNLFLCRTSPSASTVSDRSALTIANADQAKCKSIPVTVAADTNALSTTAGYMYTTTGINLMFQLPSGATSAYLVLESLDTFTPASTADISISVGGWKIS